MKRWVSVVVLFLFVLMPVRSADRTDLVGEWLFDDGTSDDTSGNGNHGDGPATVVDGISGKAMEFDGSIAIAVYDFSDNFVFDQNFTLECWVYIMDGCQTMIRKGGSANFLLELGVGRTNDPGTNPQFGFATDQVNIGASIVHGPELPYEKWTFLTMTYDGALLKAYINGVKVLENPVTGDAIDDTSQELLFGNYSSEVFIGQLDEIRIWSRTLSDEEIAADFEALAPSLRTDLVGEWLFDDGTSNDSSGNENHGDGVVSLVDGISGQAHEFDGATAIAVNEFSDNFFFTDEFSLAVWVKPQEGSATMIRKGGAANFLLELGVGRTNDPGTNPQFGFATDEVNIGASITFGPALPLDEWSFLSMTYDGSELKGYINGVLVAMNAVTGNAVNDTSQELLFGNYSSEIFIGLLDEIRIWSRTLSSAELRGMFEEHASAPDVSRFQKGTRIFADLTYAPGKALPVSIELVGQAAPLNVVETAPAEWTVSNISHGGQASDGVISWDLPDFPGELILTYVVTPPATATGSATFAGTVGPNPTGGPDTLVPGNPIGIFENHMDVGAVAVPGTATFDESTGTYTITASGREIWNHMDEFHFAYIRTSGDFTIRVFAEIYPIDGTQTWMKGGLVVREDLTPESAYAVLFVRSDLQLSYEWRPLKNIYPDRTGELIDFGAHEGGMEIERVGDMISLYFIDAGNLQRELFDEREVVWQDPVYVGLAVSASEASIGEGLGTVEATFRDVEFTGTVPISEWELH